MIFVDDFPGSILRVIGVEIEWTRFSHQTGQSSVVSKATQDWHQTGQESAVSKTI